MSIREPIAALSLQGSETEVMHAASRIFAAFVAAGRLGEDNQDALVETSVRVAVELARQADLAIQSDGESTTRSALGGR
jgi:hypothetical protein